MALSKLAWLGHLVGCSTVGTHWGQTVKPVRRRCRPGGNYRRCNLSHDSECKGDAGDGYRWF